MGQIDRRTRFRHHGWFALHLQSATYNATSVAQNIGKGGLLLVSRAALDLGTRVHMALHIDPAGHPPWILGGWVVRSQANTADPRGLWPYKMAVEFDDEVPGLVESVLLAS